MDQKFLPQYPPPPPPQDGYAPPPPPSGPSPDEVSANERASAWARASASLAGVSPAATPPQGPTYPPPFASSFSSMFPPPTPYGYANPYAAYNQPPPSLGAWSANPAQPVQQSSSGSGGSGGLGPRMNSRYAPPNRLPPPLPSRPPPNSAGLGSNQSRIMPTPYNIRSKMNNQNSNQGNVLSRYPHSSSIQQQKATSAPSTQLSSNPIADQKPVRFQLNNKPTITENEASNSSARLANSSRWNESKSNDPASQSKGSTVASGNQGKAVPISEWPACLKEYVERSFRSCPTEDDKEKMEQLLKEILENACLLGEIQTKAWDMEPIPIVSPSQKSLLTRIGSSQSSSQSASPVKGAYDRQIRRSRRRDRSRSRSKSRSNSYSSSDSEYHKSRPGKRYKSQRSSRRRSRSRSRSRSSSSDSSYIALGSSASDKLDKLRSRSNDFSLSKGQRKRARKQLDKLEQQEQLDIIKAHSNSVTGGDSKLKGLKIPKKSASAVSSVPPTETSARKQARAERFHSKEDKAEHKSVKSIHSRLSIPSKSNKWENDQNRFNSYANSYDYDDGEDEYVISLDQRIVGTCEKLDKRYLRLTTAPDPKDVRPVRILEQALEWVLKKWTEDHDYHFTCDQLKSIRQDLTVQCERTAFTVKVYETHARIALEKDDRGEFNQCQSQLNVLYRELGDTSGCQAEFTAYRILYFIFSQNNSDLQALLGSLSKTNVESCKELSHAISVRRAVSLRMYARLFNLYKSAPIHSGRLMNWFIERERKLALKSIVKAYRPTVCLGFLKEQLAFDNVEDTKTFAVETMSCILKSGSKPSDKIESLEIDCKASSASA